MEVDRPDALDQCTRHGEARPQRIYGDERQRGQPSHEGEPGRLAQSDEAMIDVPEERGADDDRCREIERPERGHSTSLKRCRTDRRTARSFGQSFAAAAAITLSSAAARAFSTSESEPA